MKRIKGLEGKRYGFAIFLYSSQFFNKFGTVGLLRSPNDDKLMNFVNYIFKVLSTLNGRQLSLESNFLVCKAILKFLWLHPAMDREWLK